MHGGDKKIVKKKSNNNAGIPIEKLGWEKFAYILLGADDEFKYYFRLEKLFNTNEFQNDLMGVRKKLKDYNNITDSDWKKIFKKYNLRHRDEFLQILRSQEKDGVNTGAYILERKMEGAYKIKEGEWISDMDLSGRLFLEIYPETTIEDIHKLLPILLDAKRTYFKLVKTRDRKAKNESRDEEIISLSDKGLKNNEIVEIINKKYPGVIAYYDISKIKSRFKKKISGT